MTNKEKFKEIFGIEPDCGPCTPYPCEENDCKYWEQCENEPGCPCEGWWNWEFKEPTTKNDLGVDKEQLKTMIRGLTKWYVKRDNTEVGEPNTAVGLLYDDVMFGIDRLPSVTPQEPRKGHWILDETDNSITCDKCGCLIWANDISNGEAYFCPNCGSNNKSVSASDYYIVQGTEKS